MTPIAFTENNFSTSTDNNRYSPRTANQCKRTIDITDDKEESRASTSNDKINFFRSMGLEFSKSSVLNDNNNNECDTIATEESSSTRPCRVARRISESFLDVPERCSGSESKLKQKHPKTSHFSDMPDSLSIASHMRECSVTIIGDKCKVCGKSFKCIKDVQLHVKRKHRRKKPRKKLVLKIGDEVISRVPIRRKHLKWHRIINDETIVGNEKAASSGNEDISDYQGSDEEGAPFIDVDGDSDIDDARSVLMTAETNDNVIINELKTQPSDKNGEYRADEDEEIQILLRITRPRITGPAMEINHETPNRTERELLISDAIREFIRMDNEPMDIIESEEHDNDIPEDYCWLANRTLPDFNLDLEERNCSFHIENEDDIECTMEAIDSSTNRNNNTYFNEGKASLHSKEICNQNGDVPNLSEYTHSLNNPASQHRYNNNVYELDSPFYNDLRTNKWNNLTNGPKEMSCDSRCMNTSISSSVLIKEEIILEDLL